MKRISGQARIFVRGSPIAPRAAPVGDLQPGVLQIALQRARRPNGLADTRSASSIRTASNTLGKPNGPREIGAQTAIPDLMVGRGSEDMRTIERTVAAFLCVAIAGCAGLTIEAISTTDVVGAREGRSNVGYVVYEPVIVYQKTKPCVEFDADGTCTRYANGSGCQFVGPILLPDETRPYSVTPHVGLGKSDINVQIKNGWMLAEFSDKSDNTAILDRIAAPKTSSAQQTTTSDKTKDKEPQPCEGLWRWDGKEKKFVPIPVAAIPRQESGLQR